jgi:predicted MFS family arabinose efflux permease
MKEKTFSRYDVFIITILTFLQFTVVLDFMVLSPLGYILMPQLHIEPSQFAAVVSAYAISAFVSGVTAAGFADRFDRKKLLLFFYAGFIIGTVLCAFAPSYHLLLAARIVTGLFGGVISSVTFAIITDLFRMEVRGRVMGFTQMAFASSQVLGIPLGLYMAERWDWHLPFFLIVGLSIIVGVFIVVYMQPVNAHLTIQSDRKPFQHLLKTISNSRYLQGFAATTLLATGGFMLMPFGSDFAVNNLGIPKDQLSLLYAVTGVASMILGPFIGKLSDSVGKYKIFLYGSLLTTILVVYYCQLGVTPVWQIMILNVLLFAGVTSRIISSSALMSGVPAPQDRGAFMGLNSSVQMLSGGVAAFVAGTIVVRSSSGSLEHYDILGYVVAAAIIITLGMMYNIHRLVNADKKPESTGNEMPKPAVKSA